MGNLQCSSSEAGRLSHQNFIAGRDELT